jgi:hypothetical protein
MNMKKIYIFAICCVLAITASQAIFTGNTHAQQTNPTDEITKSFNEIGATIHLPDANPREITLRTIRWILGLLGLIAVAMVIFGGITWMTSAGNEKRVEQAKNILTYAIIGTVIMLLSWAMVSYFINQISELSN